MTTGPDSQAAAPASEPASEPASKPGPAKRSRPVVATIAALVAGCAVAAQTSINGHTSVAVGSPVLATAVNHGSALLLSLIVALAMGALPRAARALRQRRSELRWWWFLGGLMGFVAVLAIITVTPTVGVVAVAVAVTLGQLIGSVMADSLNLGPGGRRPLNLLRTVGLGVAVIAVVVGAVGRFEVENLVVIPVVIVAGIIIAVQQAWNGWIVVVSGEFAAMSVINFATSAIFVGTALVISMLNAPIDFAALPPWAPLGGAVGAVIGVVTALTLRIIGVLSVMLCIAAGQAIAAVVLDLVVPVDAIGLTPGAVLGAVLAVAAVGIAGLGALTGARRRAADARDAAGAGAGADAGAGAGADAVPLPGSQTP
ncbi:DMT family transporter [Herbiconiux sp.]|uniref:DMT family transporter n=1 Tax=Herbiconiux sp. TaxID=1871186 RepID=UPI0025B9FC1C|nr:DMT family transporter [Herbiconiux sp.]